MAILTQLYPISKQLTNQPQFQPTHFGVINKYHCRTFLEFLIIKSIKNRKMLNKFQEQTQSIFEIKINQDKICTTFKAMDHRISSLQGKLVIFDKERQQRGIFNCTQDRMKAIISNLIFNSFQPLQERQLQHQQKLSNLQYNHRNLCSNMVEQFKKLTSDLQTFQNEIKGKVSQEQQRSKMTSKNNEKNREKIEENGTRLDNFTSEYAVKESKLQHQISKIWDNVQKMTKLMNFTVQIQSTSTKKNVNFRHSEIKQGPIDHKSLNLKGRDNLRHSISKETLLVSDKNRSSPIQYAIIVSKMEELDKKVQLLSLSAQPQQRLLSSKQRIDSQSSIKSIHDSQSLIGTNERKIGKIPNQSRFRKSIQTNQNEHQNLQLIKQNERGHSDSQTRGLHVKVDELMYKYSLLQENYEVLLSKIARIRHLQSSMQLKLDEAEKLRVDLPTINEINLRFRKIQASQAQQQSRYWPKQDYLNQMSKLKENFREMYQSISKFAEQTEVKKAFDFVERKIRQLVAVMADRFQSDKEGAINKTKQLRCLTCDKEVQQSQLPSRATGTASSFYRSGKIKNMRTTYKRIHTQDV